MRLFLVSILLISSLIADSVDMIDFESDLFSKDNHHLKKVVISLHLEGKNLQENSYALQDSLNILISSYYLEDLLTSQGKEQFKKDFINYLSNRYKVQINNIYIIKLTRIKGIDDIDELIQRLKSEGFLKNKQDIKKVFDNIQ
ncbi:MAG: hypothetical protein DSZ06_02635 [Sulfurospirillum sp.]|nr:MAG: hypothetical protein DSZ06_02635 [Sulfurospirillum sp.]